MSASNDTNPALPENSTGFLFSPQTVIRTEKEWKEALSSVADEKKAAILSRFFKTGKGQYGEGDLFIGVTVPDNRRIARMAAGVPEETIGKMLGSGIHEHRLAALIALTERYKKSRDENEKKHIAAFYLSHTAGVNNWDLVDLSAPHIIGGQLLSDPTDDPTERLCESPVLWEQRIAVVATLVPIRAGEFATALRNIRRLLFHPHDLIRKANGWMLREIGKKDGQTLLRFLDRHAAEMPRTTLRYAVERLAPDTRKEYMNRKQINPQ